jgi:chromosome segregation ATPase
MTAKEMLRYLEEQSQAIETLIDQLNEVQVEFNAQFDQFKAQHDATLDHLTDQIAERMDAISPQLRQAIQKRLPEEQSRIKERRQKVREEYLPKRRQAADDLLARAQAEVSRLRALNPQLDEREESLKREKAELEAQITRLNEEIRSKSRGLGLVRHFMSITQADRERQRILGKLEVTNEGLYATRREWEQQRQQTEKDQATLQQQWQMESIAVARLRSELDQLEDQNHGDALAVRRAIRHVLDALKDTTNGSSDELGVELQEMVKLNVETDAYHEGLASVGGVIGLLGGINSGLEAIGKSIEGLMREQEMHSAYLKPLNFSLPSRVRAFHQVWPRLAKQFADEEAIGARPASFSATVEPLLEGPLSQAKIEAMFNDLGAMIERSTAAW